jgi:hypothetical protein
MSQPEIKRSSTLGRTLTNLFQTRWVPYFHIEGLGEAVCCDVVMEFGADLLVLNSYSISFWSDGEPLQPLALAEHCMSEYLKIVLGSVVFTTLGVVLLYTDAPPIIGWLNICFGLVGVVAAIKYLRYYIASNSKEARQRQQEARQKQRVYENRVNNRNLKSSMGADLFVAFYGIKIPLDPDDEDMLDACGMETDPRCVAAKRGGLQTNSGRMTDGEDYFLYIGVSLASLGLEYDLYANVHRDRLVDVMDNVQTKLRAAGFTQQPSLHLQFVGQY